MRNAPVACARKLLEGSQDAIYELREKLADLKEQKALLIKAAGFPDDYLELHYRCKNCKDTGWVDGHKCHCFLRAQMKLLYAQSNLERVLEQENFVNFPSSIMTTARSFRKSA